MIPVANKYLSNIESYKPGKSKISKLKKVIKLSSNENPLGSSPKALKEYKKHSKDVFRYASGDCFELRSTLAKKNKVKTSQIVCGAGSDEILSLIAQAYASQNDEIIYSKHGFLMYPISAKRVGAKPVAADEKNLKTDIDAILKLINKKTKIIFIANPNNPTGSYLSDSEIDKLVSKTPKNIIIVLDHAYEELVTAKDYPKATRIVKKHPNVIVTRTFSKIYGLASLRIGWCYASQDIIDILNKVRGPFNVSGAAQKAALAALEDDKFLKKSQKHNTKWLKTIDKELSSIPAIKTYPSQANFILLDFKDTTIARKVNDALLEKGIILREMSAYHLPTCLRMTVGKQKENLYVIKTLKQLLK